MPPKPTRSPWCRHPGVEGCPECDRQWALQSAAIRRAPRLLLSVPGSAFPISRREAARITHANPPAWTVLTLHPPGRPGLCTYAVVVERGKMWGKEDVVAHVEGRLFSTPLGIARAWVFRWLFGSPEAAA